MLRRMPSSARNQGGAGSGTQTRSISAAVGRPDGQRPFQLGPCFARAGARRMVADDGGQIVEANDAFLRMLGYDREALDSGRIRRTEMTPPEWRDRTAQV
jgi:PAS domain-containing protein